MPEFKDFTKEYALKGSYHHTLSGFKALWMERNYRLLAGEVSGKVLDIACGDGRLIDFIRHPVLADGFDLVSEAVTMARGKNSYRDVWAGRIEDRQNYQRDRYDFYICSLSLQYLSPDILHEHFLMMRDIMSENSEYRFTYPNTKPEYAPGLLAGVLKKIFATVTAVPVTGFINGAEAMDPAALQKAFQEAQAAPLEKAYHYMVTLRTR